MTTYSYTWQRFLVTYWCIHTFSVTFGTNNPTVSVHLHSLRSGPSNVPERMARWRLGLEEMAMNDQISSFIRADSTSYPLSLPVLACLCVAFYLIFVASSTTKLYQPIGYRLLPQPLTLPVFGNLFSLTISNPVISMLRLSERFHDCFRLDLPGVSLVVVNSWRYVSEVCNEKVFRKEPVGPLLEARYGAGDGLFTAFTEETNWGVAHRILMPYLSQSAVKKMLHGACSSFEKYM